MGSNSRGFSLVEILLAISIFLLLASVGAVMGADAVRKRTERDAITKSLALLRTASALAASREMEIEAYFDGNSRMLTLRSPSGALGPQYQVRIPERLNVSPTGVIARFSSNGLLDPPSAVTWTIGDRRIEISEWGDIR